MTSRKVEREFSDTGHKSVTEKEEVRQSHNLYDVICECPLNIPGKQKAYPIKHRFGFEEGSTMLLNVFKMPS